MGLTPFGFILWVGSSNARGGISPELLECKWDLGPFRNCGVAESMEARLGRGRGVVYLKLSEDHFHIGEYVLAPAFSSGFCMTTAHSSALSTALFGCMQH